MDGNLPLFLFSHSSSYASHETECAGVRSRTPNTLLPGARNQSTTRNDRTRLHRDTERAGRALASTLIFWERVASVAGRDTLNMTR